MTLPKVGIRPTIDGRERGVREFLEAQTMGMAKRATKLIEENLHHASGEKVECVIADTCIGGVAEAAMCEEKFQREGVGLSLTVTPCWCYGTETIDMNTLHPKAIWGFNGTERPGAVYLAAAAAGHDQMGLPVFSIYGRDVQDSDDESIPEDVKEKILLFVKAGIALSTMKDTSYLSVGSVSMGIAGSVVNPNFFSDYLGMRAEFVDMCEIDRRVKEKIYDQEEYEKAYKWVRKNCKEGKDYNPEDKKFSKEGYDGRQSKAKGTWFGEEALGHNAILAGF